MSTIRSQIQDRILEKRDVQGSSALARTVNDTLERYPDLTLRQKDFAFRYAIEPKTYRQYANYYNVGEWVIQKWMNNPKVRALIEEIKYDMRKFTLGMQHHLLREAMMQFTRIFEMSERDDNVEAKLKAATKALEMFGFGGEDKSKAGSNINIFTGQQGEVSISGEEREVTSEGGGKLQEGIEEFDLLSQLRDKIKNYKTKEDQADG